MGLIWVWRRRGSRWVWSRWVGLKDAIVMRSVGGSNTGDEIGGWVWFRWRDRLSSLLSLLVLSLSSGVCSHSLSLSLSLSVFFENVLKVKSKRKWFYASKWLFSGQSVFNFLLIVFLIAAKHIQGCKMISWKCFQAKQTQP